jgi:hypothetical protein
MVAKVEEAAKLPPRRPSYMRLASTSVPPAPPVVAFTRSKILSVVMLMVVTTTTMVLEICGSVTRQKTWASLAPSTLAASCSSAGTPLIEAESTTMANPVWIQIMITMMKKLFHGAIEPWAPTPRTKSMEPPGQKMLSRPSAWPAPGAS